MTHTRRRTFTDTRACFLLAFPARGQHLDTGVRQRLRHLEHVVRGNHEVGQVRLGELLWLPLAEQLRQQLRTRTHNNRLSTSPKTSSESAVQ
jgi:hypothetical protein